MQHLVKFMLALIITFTVTYGHAANLTKIETKLSDSVITTKLEAKFTNSTRLNPLKISISTRQGRVTLKGFVKDKEAFVDALRLTKATKGVVSVDTDELEIKQVNTSLTDAYITAKVEATILKAKVLDDESIPLVGINATTKNGVVTLSGEVKRQASIGIIIKRTCAINGVKRVISKLIVR